MRQPTTLITGASGEIGHALIPRLAADGHTLVTLDLNPLEAEQTAAVAKEFRTSILDQDTLDLLQAKYEITTIFHLAALLSTRAEFTPAAAHTVNVDGTLKLLELAQAQVQSHGHPVRFIFPSSIAVYGLPDVDTKRRVGAIGEREWLEPRTMYGCNKLYAEQLGRYYSRYFRQLDKHRPGASVDFRAIRFPGLISAQTVPSGGTSDFVPEMLHAAAQGKPYDCFVRPDTRIPFMAMPDAVDAMLQLAAAPADKLGRVAYNITAFNPSAEEFRDLVVGAFPEAEIGYEVDPPRMAIVDSWPEDVVDDAARADWGYAPRFDLRSAFQEYLLPAVQERYG